MDTSHDHAPTDRDAYLRRRYGLTLAQYEARLLAQGGGCAICGEAPTDRPLAVDHDHACCPGSGSCGVCVRGLLCRGCNTGLGSFRDDVRNVRRAAAYLAGGVPLSAPADSEPFAARWVRGSPITRPVRASEMYSAYCAAARAADAPQVSRQAFYRLVTQSRAARRVRRNSGTWFAPLA